MQPHSPSDAIAGTIDTSRSLPELELLRVRVERQADVNDLLSDLVRATDTLHDSSTFTQLLLRTGFEPASEMLPGVLPRLKESEILSILGEGQAILCAGPMFISFDRIHNPYCFAANAAVLFKVDENICLRILSLDRLVGFNDYIMSARAPQCVSLAEESTSSWYENRLLLPVGESIHITTYLNGYSSPKGGCNINDMTIGLAQGAFMVPLNAVAAEAQAEQLEKLTRCQSSGAFPAKQVQVSEQSREFFKSIGLSSDNFLHLGDGGYGLRGSIPLGLKGELLISLSGPDGDTENIQNVFSHGLGRYQIDRALGPVKERFPSADITATYLQAGDAEWGFSDSREPFSAVRVSCPIGQERPIFDSILEVAFQARQELRNHNFELNLKRMLDGARESAQEQLLQSAANVQAAIVSEGRLSSPTCNMLRERLMEQLEILLPGGPTEKPMSPERIAFYQEMGTDRVEYQASSGLELSFHQPKGLPAPVYTIKFTPDSLKMSGDDLQALLTGIGEITAKVSYNSAQGRVLHSRYLSDGIPDKTEISYRDPIDLQLRDLREVVDLLFRLSPDR